MFRPYFQPKNKTEKSLFGYLWVCHLSICFKTRDNKILKKVKIVDYRLKWIALAYSESYF